MRHAYLIAAHNQIGLLVELLKKLDDEKNDIYLHIDIKCKDVDFLILKKSIQKSKIYFIERRSITWGDYTQIQLEIDLLKEAISRDYDYYHYISGVDFPIKSIKEIDDFFKEHMGKEFIHFDRTVDMSMIEYRIGRYHIFQKYLGRKRGLLDRIEKCMLVIQKVLHISRIRNEKIDFKKGANWFSITNDLAHYVVNCEKQIKKMYSYSYCADEIFLQTIAYNSNFRNSLYYSEKQGRYFNMRLIDWERGDPYIYKQEDYDLLLKSECLFARKFSEKESKELIKLLQN